MKKEILVVAVVCLILGGGGGYIFAYSTYQPQIDDLTGEVSGLGFVLSETTVTVSSLELEKINHLELIADMETITFLMEECIQGKVREILTLENELTSSKLALAEESRLTYTLEADIRDLEEEIETILDIDVLQYYEWEYDGTWTWTISIPLSLYFEYHTKSRPSRQRDWIDMADDPKDDYYIDNLLISMGRTDRTFNEIEMVEFVIAFVQGLPYTSDNATTGSDDYPRYPIETLFDRGGDCEDTSILTVALLSELGYDVALIDLPGHMAVGIAIDAYGSYYTHDGKKYFYLETTGEGWEIGEIPEAYEDELAYVYPLNP